MPHQESGSDSAVTGARRVLAGLVKEKGVRQAILLRQQPLSLSVLRSRESFVQAQQRTEQLNKKSVSFLSPDPARVKLPPLSCSQPPASPPSHTSSLLTRKSRHTHVEAAEKSLATPPAIHVSVGVCLRLCAFAAALLASA